MAITTAGEGSDAESNECGIAKSHAYSLISGFTMTDSVTGKTFQMMLIRNPWADNGYNDEWGPRDPRWTDELVAQIPHDFDPRKKQVTGLFVVPLESMARGKCFDAYSIAHNRESEGYVEVWYDQIDASEEEYWFEF